MMEERVVPSIRRWMWSEWQRSCSCRSPDRVREPTEGLQLILDAFGEILYPGRSPAQSCVERQIATLRSRWRAVRHCEPRFNRQS